jgi:predicted Zn-ribbon and HTH transcriptional regulator
MVIELYKPFGMVYYHSKAFKVSLLNRSMAIKEIKVYDCKCERCGHEWITRSADKPIVCPKCKSPYWKTKPLAVGVLAK